MKTLRLLTTLLIGALSLHFTSDDLSRFGTTQEEFKNHLINLASYKEFPGFKFYYSQPIKKACMSIPASEQASAAKVLGKMVKAFVMNAGFKADYEKSLVQNLRITDRSSAEMKEKFQTDYNSNLESIQSMIKMPDVINQLFAIQESTAETSKKALDNMNAKDLSNASAEEVKLIKSMQKVFKQGIDNAEAILKIKPLLKTNPSEFSKQYAHIVAEQSVQSEIDANKEENEKIIADANEKKEYKANIKSQLQQFLAESADVDFGAKIVKQSSGFEDFENEVYREKSRIWKQCFRIGKPATTAFREIAQEWMKEL
jgi:hypothetical protein